MLWIVMIVLTNRFKKNILTEFSHILLIAEQQILAINARLS